MLRSVCCLCMRWFQVLCVKADNEVQHEISLWEDADTDSILCVILLKSWCVTDISSVWIYLPYAFIIYA